MIELTLCISVVLKSILHVRMNLSPPLANAIFFAVAHRFHRTVRGILLAKRSGRLARAERSTRDARSPEQGFKVRRGAGAGAT